MEPVLHRQGPVSILYDPEHLPEVPAELFRRDFLRNRETTAMSGRGSALAFAHGEREWVLKRYERGGFVRRLSRDNYAFLGLGQTRMWREFHLLRWMRGKGLSVPTAAAARCVRTGPFTYRGSLITELLPSTETLADHLLRAPLSPERWRVIGEHLARFHALFVYHADLNARNILLATGESENEGVYLLDFDKGRVIPAGRAIWAPKTLDRLHRSLEKFTRLHSQFHFSESDWEALLAGYQN